MTLLRLPAERPPRIVFTGDPLRFAAWVPPGAPLLPPGADLRAARPDVVVALDVDALPGEALRAPGVPVLGVAVAPEAGPAAAPVPARSPRPPRRHRLLRALQRRALGRLPSAERGPVARARFELSRRVAEPPPGDPWDRLVALDPAAARGRPLWRLLTPPVDDRLFRTPERTHGHARVLVAAPSTEHRERLLLDAKHTHDVRHVAHGVTPATLPALLEAADVAVTVRAQPGPGFDHAVALHLAAGHLVVTDPLSPAHGLEADLDLLVGDGPGAIARAVGAARSAPGTHHRVRVRGHQKAQRFRASRVWPRVAGDLLADLDAFG